MKPIIIDQHCNIDYGEVKKWLFYKNYSKIKSYFLCFSIKVYFSINYQNLKKVQCSHISLDYL